MADFGDWADSDAAKFGSGAVGSAGSAESVAGQMRDAGFGVE